MGFCGTGGLLTFLAIHFPDSIGMGTCIFGLWGREYVRGETPDRTLWVPSADLSEGSQARRWRMVFTKDWKALHTWGAWPRAGRRPLASSLWTRGGVWLQSHCSALSSEAAWGRVWAKDWGRAPRHSCVASMRCPLGPAGGGGLLTSPGHPGQGSRRHNFSINITERHLHPPVAEAWECLGDRTPSGA